jgi:endonuclease/exonuclease/phosphatase family metal-dependent hydrolase
MEIDALTWNVFHGRDFPPDPALFTWRSWLFGIEERNATHVQVNRDLFREFAGVIAEARWDVALLQELPPRWAYRLARACGADLQLTPTSRNWLRSLRRPIARRLPDLMGAWEGGANAILARGAVRSRLGSEEVVLRGPPERRIVTFARLELVPDGQRIQGQLRPASGIAAAGFEPGVVVGNIHASGPSPLAAEDTRAAGEAAVKFAGDDPIILGGDFNVTPDESDVYEELALRFGFRQPTGAHAIDHLLARRLEAVEPPTAWPAEEREVPAGDRAIRLSDHAPVQARFGCERTDADGRSRK